jgi:2-(1,2-epoxy-1,2-dihydrophenyl)acetyl-CoA isomerase
MGDCILISRNDGWVEITLNRPDRLNAFNDEMHLALRAALQEAADRSDIHAVLLTGSGRGFCAGQDLGDREPQNMTGPPDLGETLEKYYNPLIKLIRDMEKPVICAVNGIAAGAGASLALACDIVLADKNAGFVQSFCKLGLIPDAGGSWLLPRLLGEARAKALILTGEPVNGRQAEIWGMIWKAYPCFELMKEARALTEELAQGATHGLARSKHLIQAAATNSLDDQLALEVQAQRDCGRTAEYAEGVRAFMQKSPAGSRGSNG